ncbi:hypothetical protein P4H42_22165 [Paenibacillus macerans]|nr:hypothetical protein [Paenibacillus macerans]MEC0332307.1 hypothetical protein [Paenibacillus macerans]
MVHAGRARSFTAEIVHLLPRETNPEAFRFMAYMLDDAGVEMLPLLPFFTHSHQDFRVQAVYQAGRSSPKMKAAHIADFAKALDDPEIRVQHTALQALGGGNDPRLLEVYERLLRQHKNDGDYYIRSNVRRRLAFPKRIENRAHR